MWDDLGLWVVAALGATVVAWAAWWASRARQVRVQPAPLDTLSLVSVSRVWYTDEASHTGDLVFLLADGGAFVAAVGMVVMHPATGEPWLVEAVGGSVNALPLRWCMEEHEGAILLPIVRPLSATDVHRAMVGVRDGGAIGGGGDGSRFVADVLARLGVARDLSPACAYDLLKAVGGCGEYNTPLLLR